MLVQDTSVSVSVPGRYILVGFIDVSSEGQGCQLLLRVAAGSYRVLKAEAPRHVAGSATWHSCHAETRSGEVYSHQKPSAGAASF